MPKVEENARKLHPRLRMVKNGDRVVNAVRSDCCTTVACAAGVCETGVTTAPLYSQAAQLSATPRWTEQVRRPAQRKLPKRPKLSEDRKANDAFVNVFVEFFFDRAAGGESEEMQKVAATIAAQLEHVGHDIRGGVIPRRNMLAATVPVTMLEDLERNEAIAFVHPADPLKLDLPAPTRAVKAPSKAVGTARKHGRGEGVVIGIIDVGGFDFAHPDFLDENGRTRFAAIWDQGGDFRDPPRGFSYGSELTKERLDGAIAAAEKAGMPPAAMIERQSQMEVGSHGTHVASIAAGKSGVCPKATIVGVLIDVPAPGDSVERRRATFSDTSRITHAVEYLLQAAGGRPIAINISLGTNGGAHDGSSGVARWLDAYLATPGRAICVAAGNAGQEAAETEGDVGWIMGRIHTSGQISSRGLEVEMEWTVVGDGIEDWSENELEIWYGPQDRFRVSVKPPGASEWIEVAPRHFVENRRLGSGTTVSIYNELYHPTNGANYIAVYLSPNLDPQNFRGIDAGVWRVRLKGEEVRDGRFNAWIERDDPVELGRAAGRRLFRFPSFFSAKTNVDSHSISSLACGHRMIAVANLDDMRTRINATSSQGPTRDGRCKPEIAARGTDVVAANGFASRDDEELWVAMTGTSMASPYVTGVVGLMLAANRDLTAAQCAGILQRTARPLPGAKYDWVNDVGYGRIDAEAAVGEARTINERVQVS